MFPALAVAASVFTIKMIDAVDIDEENVSGKNWWTLFTVFLNAVIVAILTKFFVSIVEFIVNRENHGEDSEHENSMITKSFVCSCFISFSGLLLLAYWE